RARSAARPTRSQVDALQREHAPLVLHAEVAEGADPVRGDDAMTGDEHAAPGRPASAASSPYVTTSPRGTERSTRVISPYSPSGTSSSTSAKSSGSPAKNAASRPARACPGTVPGPVRLGRGCSDQRTTSPSSHNSPTPQPGASHRTSFGLISSDDVASRA